MFRGLTTKALEFLGFSHWETLTKKYLYGRVESTEPVAVFNSTTKVGHRDIYTAEHGGKTHALRKFTLREGRVFHEKVLFDIQWGKDEKDSTVYTALQDENGNWADESLWIKVIGKGFFGFEIKEPIS